MSRGARPRSITFDGHVWRVRVHHRHAPPACAEVLSVFRADRPGRVARVVFREGEGRGRGWPGASGAIVDAAGGLDLNLHRPVVARLVVELAIAAGFDPDGPRAEREIDGWALLAASPEAVRRVVERGRQEG